MKHVSVNFIRPAREPFLRRMAARLLPGHSPESASFSNFTFVTWLVENAEHMTRVHPSSKGKMTVVFVGDFAAIPPHVLETLRDAYVVVDASLDYERLVAEFPNISARYGGPFAVFTFGFLRWILIHRMFGGEDVLCYDGDIVQNVSLDDLAAAFSGLTRTATSTCFASVCDPEWFRSWERNLRAFERDSVAFLEARLPTLKYGVDQFNSTPEEYFAKFLIEAEELPQQELPEDFPLWIIPQPQTLPRLFNFVRSGGAERIPAPMSYGREGGIDSINGRPVGFWHMQKPFMSQLSALAILLRELGPEGFGQVPPVTFYGKEAAETDYLMNDPYHHLGGTPTVPIALRPTAARLTKQMREMAARRIPPKDNPFHPAFLYDYYFRDHDFSSMFNARRWPRSEAWIG